MRFLSVHHEAIVGHDAVKPCGEFRFSGERFDPSVCVYESLLQNLLGFFRVAANLERKTVDQLLIFLYELSKSALVTGFGGGD